MNVRTENIHTDQSPANYVSFLRQPPLSKGRSDRDSMHSVSSIRSVMSGLSSFWSTLGMGSSVAKTEKAQIQLRVDTKYLYSAFTKIPCLRLSPDHRARLISGYEEFPFDTAVPLWAFKNLSALEIYDLDFRQFFGWDRLSEQLRSLTIKRGSVEDPLDLIVHIVLDDMDKRRRRSSKFQSPPTPSWPGPSSPASRQSEYRTMSFSVGTPDTTHLATSASPRNSLHHRGQSEILIARSARDKSNSPTRPTSSRHNFPNRYVKMGNERMRRSGSASSHSSTHSLGNVSGRRSSSNLLLLGILPASKWRFLRHLSLADNSLTSLTSASLAPLANTLHSLDLSSNLFVEVPDCLASLTALRALNLSNCMIESLHSLARSPLPAITALNLRANRLSSLAGIEKLCSLERVDFRENRITDPTELARLTGVAGIREVFVLGNPFVRLHSNYRVTIFNLFRNTPGYTEDITIDSTGPGYSERRQLKERVAKSAAISIIRVPSAVAEESNVVMEDARFPTDISNRVVVTDRPIPHSTQSEVLVGSARRKRISKRRIVDLSTDSEISVSRPKRFSIEQARPQPTVLTPDASDSNTSTEEYSSTFKPIQPSSLILHDDPFMSSSNKMRSTQVITEDAMTPPKTPLQPLELSHNHESILINELENLKLGSDPEAYQQKLELLKNQLGPRWLQISDEARWTQKHSTGHTMADHTSGKGLIVTSGRTLG